MARGPAVVLPRVSERPGGHARRPESDWLRGVTGRLLAFDIGSDGSLSGRRVFAEELAPDGICLDAAGAIWVSTGLAIARVADGGEVLQRVELPEGRAPFAMMLGGSDRRTLFILTAAWDPASDHTVNLARLIHGPYTGEILTLPVAVPGVGRP